MKDIILGVFKIKRVEFLCELGESRQCEGE